MINYNKINDTILKIVNLCKSLKKLNKEELMYLKTLLEIKLYLDKFCKDKKWIILG